MMELQPDKLRAHLDRGKLASCYVLGGDEPLQVLEAARAVRAAAQSQGFDEREVLHVDNGFDWGRLADCGASLSLFSAQRLLEVHLNDKSPGKTGSAALAEYVANPPADTLLVIVATPLAASVRKTAWYKAIEKAGVAMYAWPLAAAQMHAWLARRARNRGLRVDADGLAVLAAHTEGNLLAAAQQIDRLVLLHGDAPIGADAVATAASDDARFGIFDLPAKALAADSVGALRSLSRLRAEGVDAVAITWALVREIRLLYQAARAARAGRLDAMLAKVFMPAPRKRALAAAAKRADPAGLARLLTRAAALDSINKGAARGRTWDELVTLTLGLAGHTPREPAIAADSNRP